MREIIQDGAKILRNIAKPVPESLFNSTELIQLIADMSETLDSVPEGVAIAAPQIGVSYRVFIVRKDRTIHSYSNAKNDAHPPEVKPEIEVYINPEIVKTSRKKIKSEEGCLSVRGIYGITKRHEKVMIKARSQDGRRFQRGASGLFAQIFEHEIEHLNGILFTDHATNLLKINKKNHKFAFFGTPKVASDTLAILLKYGLVPEVVITSPDAPKGRGLIMTQSETKSLALNSGISVITPDKLDSSAILDISAFKCDYAIVVAYGKIFPEELIRLFPSGVLNIHYSLLPKYRGATPVETAFLCGEKETGVTIQKMSKELDAGDILAQEAIIISADETVRELRPRLINLGAKLLVDTLPAYLYGKITPIVQDASLVTRSHKIKKEDGFLSLKDADSENWNKYRAYIDNIGTYIIQDGKRLKITKARFENGKFFVERVVPEGKNETDYK